MEERSDTTSVPDDETRAIASGESAPSEWPRLAEEAVNNAFAAAFGPDYIQAPNDPGARQSPNWEPARYLRWAIWSAESLHYLRDVATADDPHGMLSTPRGHTASSANLGYVMWASVTAVGALDRVAAAFGMLHLPRRRSGRVYDFREIAKHSEVFPTSVQTWIREVKDDRLHADLLDVLRDPVVHRVLPRRVTFGVRLSDLFDDAEKSDERKLMFSAEFEGVADSLEIVVPGPSGLVTFDRIFEPDRFTLPNGQAVSGFELIDVAIEATDRHVRSAVGVIVEGHAWPRQSGASGN